MKIFKHKHNNEETYNRAKHLSNAGVESARAVAVEWLSRREYSRFELLNKLIEQGAHEQLAEDVLVYLGDMGYQSDVRFVESLANSYVRRGRGPVRLYSELDAHNIDQALSQQVLNRVNIDWEAVALKTYQKKYGDSQPGSYHERAKRMRFMYARGFDKALIYHVLEQSHANEY